MKFLPYFRREKQLKDLKEKGWFHMGDGTKSSDYDLGGQKKKVSGDAKPGKKRTSSVSKEVKAAVAAKKTAGRPKTPVVVAKAQSQDDLDIEQSASEVVEGSD